MKTKAGKMIERYSDQVTEASFARTIDQMKNKDFALLTAFRPNFSKDQNRKRNNELLSTLRPHGIGGTALTGHWLDAETKDEVVEESFLFVKPEKLEVEAFKKIILDMVIKYDQDAALLGLQGSGVYVFEKSGEMIRISDKNTKIDSGVIEKGYSKMRGHTFVFESYLDESEFVYEMSNIRQDKTGLPMVIWVQPKTGREKHGPRIKVQTNHSIKSDPGKLIAIGFTREGSIINFGGLNKNDFDLVSKFMKLNMEWLIKLWDDEISPGKFEYEFMVKI
jgi:hypothetical protein